MRRKAVQQIPDAPGSYDAAAMVRLLYQLVVAPSWSHADGHKLSALSGPA